MAVHDNHPCASLMISLNGVSDSFSIIIVYEKPNYVSTVISLMEKAALLPDKRKLILDFDQYDMTVFS